MRKYLVLYRSSVSPQEMMAGNSPEDAGAGMEQWMAWAGKTGDSIVDLGSPLSSVETVGGAGEHIGGFSVLEAESRDALVALLDGHPHFQGPGDPGIEVLEFLPIPGM